MRSTLCLEVCKVVNLCLLYLQDRKKYCDREQFLILSVFGGYFRFVVPLDSESGEISRNLCPYVDEYIARDQTNEYIFIKFCKWALVSYYLQFICLHSYCLYL